MISQSFTVNNRMAVQRGVEKYKKPFLIDPETYRYFLAFKHHYKGTKKNRKIRSWLSKMSVHFPEEIKNNFGKKAAKVENFDALQMLEFCQSNIELQTSLEHKDGSPLLPIGIVAPYLRISAEKINSNLLFQTQVISTTSKINKSDLPVIGVFYISRDILSRENLLKQVTQSIRELDCESIAVWVDNFNEVDATEEELTNLRTFYSNISADKHILSMYGGVAQIMMMYNGLDSITHGVHYQMHKDGLANGGTPAYYFYVPNFRQRIRTIEASAIIRRQNFLREEYLKKCCDCPSCQENISMQPAERIFSLEGNESYIVKTLTGHFAYNKKLEINNVLDLSKEDYSAWIMQKLRDFSITRDEFEYSDKIKSWLSIILDVEIYENN
ncbi:hypothetical protein SD78_1801 [Bacillus badius]|nr:hypothetical protein SD78_1801 [Bacillus badius]